jgi:L-rhamnose isomerase/sugar isomerase
MDIFRITDVAIGKHNEGIDAVRDAVAAFNVAVPSWGVGTGGTRFARFPGPGEPRNVFEKLDDCDVIHRLGRISRTVSLHFPWDATSDLPRLKQHAAELGLGFDAPVRHCRTSTAA